MRWLTLLCFVASFTTSAQPYGHSYNVTWNSQSKNASGSMPCGGGDIGLNVWVEKGDLLIYATRSGSFNEDNNLMKAGRIRIRLLPNPFEGRFKQELHLQEGYVTVEGENNGIKAMVKIWVDVFNPVAHFDITASKKIHVEAGYESWRYKDRLLLKREGFSSSWKWAQPVGKQYPADKIGFSTGGVLFYHNNGERTIFDTTVTQQGMDMVKSEMYNPVKNLALGGLFRGPGFIDAGTYEGVYEQTDFMGWKLRTKQTEKTHKLILALHTAKATDFGDWHQSFKPILLGANDKHASARTQDWWREFWSRSFITVNKDSVNSAAWTIGRNYQLFRYMLGCNSGSMWPTKFNGGLFTVDPVYTDTGNKGLTPDYRNWGGGCIRHRTSGWYISR